jgi:hypothetical protein
VCFDVLVVKLVVIVGLSVFLCVGEWYFARKVVGINESK